MYNVLLGTAAPPMMQTIINGTGDAFALVGTVIGQIVAQPVLLFCLAASLIPIGIGIFRSLRGATV